MGTSWVLMEVTDTPRFNDINFVGVNNYPVPGKFCSYVYIPTGGKALNWLRQLLTAGKDPIPSYDEMTTEAENVPAGASGLFFIDRLAGTLFPTWQAESNAQFTGMNLEHGRGHLIRSVLEGVCFEYAVMLRELKAMGGAKNPGMIALGGASRSDLWMKIAASVYQKRLRVFTEPDLAPIGAAMIAAEGEGLISADSGQGDWCQLEVRLVEPDEKLVPVYEKLLDEYIALG
jgi:xylulokinase